MIVWIVIALLLMGAVGLGFWIRHYQAVEPAPAPLLTPESPTAA